MGTYWSKVHDQLGVELASRTLLVMDVFSGADVQPENSKSLLGSAIANLSP
jgi:hypothetical protein